jgi:hypothetical protein
VVSLRTSFWHVIFVLLLIVICSQVSIAQSEVQISLEQEDPTAGDNVTSTVTFPQPVPCDTTVFVAFRSAITTPDGYSFALYGPLKAGQTVVKVSSKLLFDTPAGEYQSVDGYYTCEGFRQQKHFAVPSRVLRVKALPDSNNYPTVADLTLSATQKQFFDTKIAELDRLDSEIDKRIESNADDLPDLRTYLGGVVDSAQKDLEVTEKQYLQQVTKSPISPSFFADFKAQYNRLRTELKAPIPGLRASREKRSVSFVQVQLQLKPRPSRSQSELPKNISGAIPGVARDVKKVISDNKSAYKYIRDSGRITFDAQFTSTPTGAFVRYRKLIDSEYKDYGAPTNVPNVSLDLATWVFEFRKDNCSDTPQTRIIDPYEDTHPNVSVEFRNCGPK